MGIEQYDIFVIGTGAAGKKVAEECAEAGMSVAIADNREFGGTCSNRGCDPKKVLVGVTELLELSRDLEGKGIIDLPQINWADLMKFKDTFTSPIPFATEQDLEKAGIKMYHQSPTFMSNNTLLVEGKTVKAKKIVIATGMVPRPLKIPGREYALTSDDFLELPELPGTMVFIGAGYIGMEFAHIAARCGAKVTVIDVSDQILSNFEPKLAGYLKEKSEQLGIEFIMCAEVKEIEHLRKNYRVTAQRLGETIEIVAAMVFNTSGRMPAVEELDLEKGNVAHDHEGVIINEYLQSPTNPIVYACGDVSASGNLPLTPLSGQEARVVYKNLIKGNHLELEIPITPSVVFTQPQLATVGLTEKRAKQIGYDYILKEENVPDWYNPKRMNQNCYAFKTLVDKKTGIIIGAHILSFDAGETINMFVMAMHGKIDYRTLKSMVFTYPSWASDIKAMV